MNESRLEKLRDAWRETPSFSGRPLDEAAVERALARQSRDVTRQFRVALTMDIVLKTLLAAALAVLALLYRDTVLLAAMHAGALLETGFCIAYLRATLRDIPGAEAACGSVRGGLAAMLDYYRNRFRRALFVVALTGPLVFYTGVFYYLWFRYGGPRPFDGADLAVFLGGLAIAYVLNATAQLGQFHLYVSEVEDCLREIDENGGEAASDPVRRLQARRRRRALAWSLMIALGVVVLAWLAV